MSKTIDSLKTAQEYRKNGYSVQPPKPQKSEMKPKLVYFFIFLLFFFNLGLNLSLFLMVKGYSSEKINTVAKLSKIEGLLNSSAGKMDSLSAAVKNMNQETNARISQLEKDQDARSFAIANLVKAKDTLFKRISELESKEVAK